MTIEKHFRKKIYGPHFAAWVIPSALHRAGDGGLAVCQGLLGRSLKSSPYQGSGLHLQEVKFRELMHLCLAGVELQDVYWILASRRVDEVKHLKALWHQCPWDLILPAEAKVGLKVQSYRSRLYHEGRLAESLQDLLIHSGFSFCEWAQSPFRLWLRLEQDQAFLALSMAGPPLYRRGYRSVLKAEAPLAEDLAASLTAMALDPFRDQVDQNWDIYAPFAGSGTLGFEAARHFLKLGNIWPRTWSFSNFICCPKATQNHLLKSLQPATNTSQLRILFQEINKASCAALSANAQNFRLPISESKIDFQIEQADTFAAGPAFPDSKRPLFIAINPPWGERLTQGNIAASYQAIGAKVGSQTQTQIAGYIVAPDAASQAAFQIPVRQRFHLRSTSFSQSGQRRFATFFHRLS